MQLRFVLLAALLGAAFVSASSSEHVLKLTDGDFAEKTADGKVYFIKFFAPWCGHCKRLAPTWEELAKSFADNPKVSIASVDCTEHKDTCTAAEIRGYPTLKVYHAGAVQGEAYKGGRELAALTSHVEEQVKSLLSLTTE